LANDGALWRNVAQRKALKTLAFVNGQEKTLPRQQAGFQVFGGEGVRQYENKINALQPSSPVLFHQKCVAGLVIE
jgi:hypothetical protein